MTHPEKHPLAGRTVRLKPDTVLSGSGGRAYAGTFDVEDWQDRVFGRSWMTVGGNPAALIYAMRSGAAGLPVDDDVVYGKDERGLGHIVHVTEIEEEL